ncbi:MAG: DUF1670 domain-containing protein [Firmicutes bacterium]|nr:DUF1670 domain-containing protein [Bacillota bacterium]
MGRLKKEPRHYESLLERNLFSAQKHELALHFELSEQSWIAEAVTAKFNRLLDDYEGSHGIPRAKPCHLILKYCGEIVQIPLLTEKWASLIANDRKFSSHRQRVVDHALTIFKSINPAATMADVNYHLNRRALIPRLAEGECKRTRMPTSAKLINPNSVIVQPLSKVSDKEVTVPASVQSTLMTFLTDDVGIGPSTSMSMIRFLAARREEYCPPLSQLKPGQIVWLALSVSKHKPPSVQFARRIVLPVVLTIFTEEEARKPIHSLEELNRLNMEQCARVLVEAYLQDALLPQVELSLLFLRSYSVLANLVKSYMNIHNVILPTPGTILDSGTAMTHKDIIVADSVSGLLTTEIARKTYHTPESVDAYLKVFHSVLILYLYDMPVPLMARVTGRGQSLIEEYIRLVKEHFPNRDSIKAYLKKHGLKIG